MSNYFLIKLHFKSNFFVFNIIIPKRYPLVIVFMN
jgi:hypothetical protein